MDWSEDAATNRTWFAYDETTGRRIAVTNALGDVTHTEYDVQGRVTNTWGATYPVAYAYDGFGRMSEMHTWRQEGGTPDVTRWLYDEATGLLTNKLYADGKGVAYTYTADGKLATRVWARGVTTTYSYDNCCGALTNIQYNNNSPSPVHFNYDRLGRLSSVNDAASHRAFAYRQDLQLDSEELVWNLNRTSTNKLTRTYDDLGCDTGYALSEGGGTVLSAVEYGYDAVGRLSSVAFSNAAGVYTNTYTYLEGSDQLAGRAIELPDRTLSVSRGYEAYRDLIATVTNVAGTELVSSFAYDNDMLGRRTNRVDTASITNAFGYNPRSELIEARMGANTYSFRYDPIGNRTVATNKGESLAYQPNLLNQYTNIISDGTAVEPAYDADGNLTNHVDTAYGWDGENRLVSSGQPGNLNYGVWYTYDYMGRRVRKWTTQQAYQGWYVWYTYYLWDGWNLIREEVVSANGVMNPGPTNDYAWGLDLSGSRQGAGGIGGLLAMTRVAPYEDASICFAVCDANGNVTDYVATNGTNVAHYDYDAYGGLMAATGTRTNDFAFRFSTKYQDVETDFYYYGQRYYSPELGRWVNRDPIGEGGGENLYLLVANNAGNAVDPFGFLTFTPLPPGTGTGWIPPGWVFPGSGTDADTEARIAIFLFILGGATERTYGPDNPWTQAHRDSAAVSGIRAAARRKIAFACSSGQAIGGLDGDDWWGVPLWRLPVDVVSYLGLWDASLSHGTFHYKWKVKEGSTCCCPTVRFDLDDTLSVSSMTRIPLPRTPYSWLPTTLYPDLPMFVFPWSVIIRWPSPREAVDRPPGSFFGNMNLHWWWEEDLCTTSDLIILR